MAAYRSACSPHTHIIKTAVGLLGISVTVRSEPALLAAVGLLGISATVRSEPALLAAVGLLGISATVRSER